MKKLAIVMLLSALPSFIHSMEAQPKLSTEEAKTESNA